MKDKRLYRIWGHIKQRCNNKKNSAYERYGGRGICICDEWSNYENFNQWALSNGYKDYLTIDRIDVDGNYEPNNCRWVDYKAQNRNKRNSRYITYKGETKHINDFADEYNIPYGVVANRVWRGWSAERIYNTQPQYKEKMMFEYNGKKVTLLELSRILGISKNTLKARLRRGCSYEELISPRGDIARKNVLKIDPQTQEIVGRFKGTKDALLSVNGKSTGSIIDCCNGKHKTAYGFIWKYENKQLNERRV